MVKVGYEMLNPLIGLSNQTDILQTRLFNQAILQCFIHPFHTTFGMAAVGVNEFDHQYPESRYQLGGSSTLISWPTPLNSACFSL